MATLNPDYLSIDFSTLIERIKTQLQNSDTFADYNFEGSNIAILIELVAYIAELNTYFTNKIAKNVHIETADIYEAVNRAARQMGYEPKGTVSSRGTVTVTVTAATPGNTYQVLPFTPLECSEVLDDDGNTIKFANTTLYSTSPTASSFEFDMTVKQGEVVQITGYDGGDLVDNELILPSSYAYDNDLDDDYPALSLTVNGVEWTRISDFYDELSAYYTEDNVYMFVYDRYGRSKIVFNSARNVPSSDDVIALTVLRSLGADGDVFANSIDQPTGNFLYDVDNAEYFSNDNIAIANSSATVGGADAESIDSIKPNAKAALHRQYRNVTAADYRSHLEARSDVDVGQAWGEQDTTPSGSINNFNRVHLSVIPYQWGDGTIRTSSATLSPDWSTSTGSYLIPSAYDNTWETTLKTYLEPRKIISAYEKFNLPSLVYFAFDIGVRIKRAYTFSEVSTDILNKLEYWFRHTNQDFNSIINFNDITEFILDPTEISDDDNYENVKGIRNLNIREIDVSHTVYEPNEDGNYPYYVEASTAYTGENQLRRIQLGFNQFPKLLKDICRVSQES